MIDQATIPTTAKHPLDRLQPEEMRTARKLLHEEGVTGPSTRFAYVALDEPPKAEVLAFTDGDPVPRRVKALLVDVDTGRVTETLVSVTELSVESVREVDVVAEGQPPILGEEFEGVGELVAADEQWKAALARRGITDPAQVCACPLSAGVFDIPGEEGRRMMRVLGFLQHRPEDHPWAHPIDGLVAYVDLIERKVVEVIDHSLAPIPAEEGNFDDPRQIGPARTDLRPIEITQPEGPSFHVSGDVVTWHNWTFRVGFDAREGLVLHQISYRDGDRQRPIVYRASVAEMVVPYGDPSPVRFWQNYFDAGEYLLGKQANSLQLGCDCLGEIHYFDAVVADDHGAPLTIDNAICMHEEDYGVLWKHTDIFTGSRQTRRQRRLVISFFVTVGNYDYGFYWYLYLDGTIELECKATGIVFTSAHPGSGHRWASEVAPGLGAPFHQHLFGARLDMMVDGVTNAVDEVEVRQVPVGEENPYGNGFTYTAIRLPSEAQAGRVADNSVARSWHVTNPEVTNRLGRPVGYVLYPEGQPTLLADEGSSVARRAAFATKHLWVSRYQADQRWPAGEHVNQNAGGAGLPEYTAADRSIDGVDLVLWHTFGMTHFPRTEDWPIMPVDYCGFTLKPCGFFDHNPTLDVPAATASHCADGMAPGDGDTVVAS
ncbi:primary-amine oxidase [Haloactinomyces albus]|uniref:Amine oxidase n=1 Tax=Haloactinomyces albus TaxID=1352928 RepID=A0AAE4CNP3_9ACTN|nr:primary-amine oxidase [Haloactinomyces albus]MDR7304089.1 primary-amine oxidase [Haloactinomyces albus]